LAEVAARHGASTRQVALAFIVRHKSVFTIPKSAHEDHVEENARAADLDLDDTDLARIEAAFPRGRRRRGVPML
jgi:diketogulonate reductase-like aldo/keto reductase